MHLINVFVLCLVGSISAAELNWDYGNWFPMAGPCATCFPSAKSVESRSNIHSSFGESNSRGRQFQFVQEQPFNIVPQAEDVDNSIDTVQLVYLPEGSLRNLRTAKVARVEESQLRPVRQATFQDFQSSNLGAESQQLQSFRSLSPKRPTALIAERGQENEAQQQIQLLEAALNSQFEDVKPGELPKVFIAPTHVPPPPGYVKIPLLPSQSSVQSRSSLPRTFLTSEFHNNLPNGFVQLPLPENVAHLSHDIPFVHPDSNPLLLAHFSPASTLKNFNTNQRQPSARTNELHTPTQGVNQFPTSSRGSNQFPTPTNEFNHFQPQLTETNHFQTPTHQSIQLQTPIRQASQFQTPTRQSDQFPVPIPEVNQIRVAPSSLLRQPEVRRPQASTDDKNNQRQNFGQQPIAPSVAFTESNFNFNEDFDNQHLQAISSQAEIQEEANIDFSSDPFIQPNEVNVQQQLTPVQQTDRQTPHRFQIGTPVVFTTDRPTFTEDQPIVKESGFNDNHFNQENEFGFQEEKINEFDAPQQLPPKRLRPRPVSNEPQFLNEPVTESHQIVDEAHFLTTAPTVVEFEESHKSLKPLHDTPLEEENFDGPSNFKLSLEPVLTTIVPESTVNQNDPEHQQTSEQQPELSLSTASITEEKELEKPIAPEVPVGVRNRGRKRLRPDGARGRGRHLNRNRFNNIIPNEEQNKESLPFTTIIPNEHQTDHSVDDTPTTIPARSPNTRSRIPARRQRPNQQRIAPSKPEAVVSVADAEETTLFPPFSVARQQSNLNEEEGVTAEVVPTQRKDALLRGRFGSRVRSRVQEPNEERPVEESGKSENAVADETVLATRGRNHAAREQAGARNSGRPAPEWLKNRRRTRVLSRVRKVHPSESTPQDTVTDTQELVAEETDLKGAESARFSVSQAFGETLPIPTEQSLINNEKIKDDFKAKVDKIEIENTESPLPGVLETETTTENKFEEILEILHLDSRTEETPLEVATVQFSNGNENLPVVELQEDISEPNVEEGYVDYISSQSNPVEIDKFSKNRDELEHSSRTDKLEESTSSPSFDIVIDSVSHSSSNSKPQISSSFITSRSTSSDIQQNIEPKDTDVEDTRDTYFDNFFDVSSTDEKPRLPSNLRDGENLTGSSAHIVYAVALNESPKENSLSDTSKPDTLLNSKEATESLDRSDKTTTEDNVETTTGFSSVEIRTEAEEIEDLTEQEKESIQGATTFSSPSDASTLNFLESFFANKSRPSTPQHNEVHELKAEEGQTVIGSSTVTEVRSSAPVICFSEGNCVVGIRKKRNS